MNADALRLRAMSDDELQATIAKLRGMLGSLSLAQTDVALLVRDSYRDALTAALNEQERRGV